MPKYFFTDCQLEIDGTRGVIYVHYKGGTLLRICGVKKNPPAPKEGELLDITLKHQNLKPYTFNW